MIRIMYRWTVKAGGEDEFIRYWEEGTRRIQANCAGALGSLLIRDQKDPARFFGFARWESREAYFAALPVMQKLGLPGPMPETYEFFDELRDMPPATKH